ncbi:MAG: hypothetical protein ABJD53_06770, partial [Gammaproteobacteria bacterium]
LPGSSILRETRSNCGNHLQVNEISPAARVHLESPDQPEVIALIGELDAYQDTLYPAESRHSLDLNSLKQANVIFAVGRDVCDQAVAPAQRKP